MSKKINAWAVTLTQAGNSLYVLGFSPDRLGALSMASNACSGHDCMSKLNRILVWTIDPNGNWRLER